MVSFSLVFSNIAYAQTCEVSNVKQVLKKVVYLHLMEPQSSQLTLDEIRDLLFFYLGIDEGLITVDCSVLGPRSNKPVSDIVSSGETAPDKVPACADGTEYGECSTFKPKYCYAGSLLHRCNYCGCPSASSCSTDGKCEAVKQNITCYNDIDCGTSQFTGNYYCSNNYITKNYQNYTCENAGTVNSGCVIKTSYVSIEYCDSSLNQTCIEGQSTCKTANVSVVNETTNVTNQTTLSPTGVCEVRDSYTSVPLFSAPDVGVGYAKKAIAGVNTLDGLKIGCTNSTFYAVMQSYCTQNSNPMQQEIVTYNSAGNWQSATCGANGCSYYFCKYLNYPPPNSGVCMVSDAYTSISQIAFWDPDVGKGYAKMAKNGINTITGLRAICTKADYDSLVQKYCAQNSNQVQEGVVTYGPGGGMTSSSCGAFGCDYRSCSTITNQTSNQTVNQTTKPSIVTLEGADGTWCFDSDGSGSYFSKGYCQDRNGGTYYDFCDGGTVRDYYCTGVWNGAAWNNVRCEHGGYVCTSAGATCSDGACITESTASKPDLVVTDITFTPVNPTATDYIKVNITIKNIGAASAGAAAIKLDYPGGFWRSSIPSLNPGLSYDFINLGNGPFPAGTQNFIATIDEYDWVSEQNESNNILIRSLTVAS